MIIPDQFESERLLFRRPTMSDAEAIFRTFATDPEVTRFVSWPTHKRIDDTKAFLEFSDTTWKQSKVGPYLITSRADARLLGSTGLQLESPHMAMTGYVFARQFWKQGFATETVRAIIYQVQTSFVKKSGLFRLYAYTHVDHHASSHVLEKCGFELEGVLRNYCVFPNLLGNDGLPSDVRLYALILR